MEIEESDIDIGLLKKYIHYAKCKISPRLTEVHQNFIFKGSILKLNKYVR
jgi:hypothetical protein